MGIQRINLTINKKTAAVKYQKIEIAKLLQENKEEKARIKVEHVIREDFLIEVCEDMVDVYVIASIFVD